ncbi:MAG: hypothetical protein R2865_05910 [Deinococcales bacterium]
MGKVLHHGVAVWARIAFGSAKFTPTPKSSSSTKIYLKALKLAQELRQAEINCEVHPLDSLAEHVRVDGLSTALP